MVVTYRLRRDSFMEAAKRFKALASPGDQKEGSQDDAVRSRGQALEKEGLELCKEEVSVLERLRQVTVELEEVIDELKARE